MSQCSVCCCCCCSLLNHNKSMNNGAIRLSIHLLKSPYSGAPLNCIINHFSYAFVGYRSNSLSSSIHLPVKRTLRHPPTLLALCTRGNDILISQSGIHKCLKVRISASHFFGQTQGHKMSHSPRSGAAVSKAHLYIVDGQSIGPKDRRCWRKRGQELTVNVVDPWGAFHGNFQLNISCS